MNGEHQNGAGRLFKRGALPKVYVDYLKKQIMKSADDRELTDTEQTEIDANMTVRWECVEKADMRKTGGHTSVTSRLVIPFPHCETIPV